MTAKTPAERKREQRERDKLREEDRLARLLARTIKLDLYRSTDYALIRCMVRAGIEEPQDLITRLLHGADRLDDAALAELVSLPSRPDGTTMNGENAHSHILDFRSRHRAEKLNELSLFTGAGGGLLASHLLGFRTICAVEHDAHCQRVLVQRQNDGILDPFPIWDDVRTFDGRPWSGRVDLVSGGFPCQAFSTAAAGRNNAENLWPEMRRIVADVAPRLVFAENVACEAIELAAADLRALGYETRAVSMSAADLGADHIRERHWLLAYADNEGELLRRLNAEMASRARVPQGVWASYPNDSRVDDGVANRVDRYRASGNGQVAAVAYAAFVTLVRTLSGSKT